jgi:hypothetical protein
MSRGRPAPVERQPVQPALLPVASNVAAAATLWPVGTLAGRTRLTPDSASPGPWHPWRPGAAAAGLVQPRRPVGAG